MTSDAEEALHDQLFRDIIESGGGREEWAGLAVWGEPWDPQSWEMSEPFVRKWAWLIEGCPEIMLSTNLWRSMRGDKPLASQTRLGRPRLRLKSPPEITSYSWAPEVAKDMYQLEVGEA